jgi:penicillin amidase
MHGDPKQLYAVDILPYVLSTQPSDPTHAQLLDLLRDWDGYAWRDSVAAAVFEALRVHLVDRAYGDELGDQLLNRSRSSLMIALKNHLPDPETSWFDDIYTDQVETRDEIKNQSLGQSGIWLLEWLLNRGPVAVDGSSGTPNATSYSFANPYEVSAVPSQRHILDFQYFEQSLSMHTTGQSGHPFHPHYDDMIDPWRNIEYHPMLWTRGQVEAAVADYLVLTP